MALAPLSGSLLLSAPQTLEVALMGAGGIDTTSVTRPNNAAFVGTHLTWQSAVVAPSATTGLWTCATDMFANP